MKTYRIGLAALLLALTAGTSFGGIHYFSQADELYRWDSGTDTLTSVTINAASNSRFAGLGIAPDGTLWASDNVNRRFYTVDPITGDTTLQFSYAGAAGSIISFDFRDNGGTLEIFGMSGDTLHRFDANTGASLGSQNQGIGGAGFPSTAYDPSGQYYGAANDGNLYDLSFTGSASNPRQITEGGSALGWRLAGGAWFDGQYHMGVTQSSDIRLGVLDVVTGEFATQKLFSGIGNGDAMGYAVAVPVPAAALLGGLGLAVVGAIRRRLA